MAVRVKVLIVSDLGSVLDRLQGRLSIFWPPEKPVKITPVYCAWADEAIEAIQEYRPDILILTYAFRKDEKTGKDVARWIDENYRKPILVAAHSDDTEDELRELFSGTQCVKYFIAGDRVRDFIENCVTTRP